MGRQTVDLWQFPPEMSMWAFSYEIKTSIWICVGNLCNFT